MRRLLLPLLFLLPLLAPLTHAQSNPQTGHGAPTGVCVGPYTDTDTGNLYVCKTGQYTLAGSSSSASSTGPVINVTNAIYAGGASSSNADNSAQFTAAVAAYNTAVDPASNPTTLGVPVSSTSQQYSALATSGSTNINLTAGTTTLVFIAQAVVLRTFTITDSGGSIYTLVNSGQTNNSAGAMLVFATGVGQTKASTSVSWSYTGTTQNISIGVVSYNGLPNSTLVVNPVGSNPNAAAGTSFAASQTTLRAASTIVMGCGMFNTNAATLTATTGTVRTQVASSASTQGIVVLDNLGGGIGATVNLAGTWSASSFSDCVGIEVQSFGQTSQLPTLYMPAGHYSYSGGLAMTQPGTLKCEPGTFLYYTGSAHAADMGPTGLSGGNSLTTVSYPYYVDGCFFSGGPLATQGIFFNTAAIIVGVRNSTFLNFGSAASPGSISGFWAIAGQCDQWDFEVGPQVRMLTNDFIPRNYVRSNIGACDANSFMRVHDSEFYGLAYSGGNGTNTNASQAGIGVYADGDEHIISLNSFGWLNPDVVLACSAAITQCYGSRIDNNLLDAQANCSNVGANCFSPLTYRNVQAALSIQHNNFDMQQATTLSPIGPWDAASAINTTRFNFNQCTNCSNSNPFVKMNNLTGQTNNQSSNNFCTTGGGFNSTFAPCPLPHTTGSNINNFTFNVDDQHVAGLYGTTTNCNVNSASPAACGGSPSGSVVVPTTTTTYTVNTTAVTASSRIILLPITDGTGLTGAPTCVAPPTPFIAYESARVAATSFTFTLPSTTGTSCWTYWIVN